MGTRSTVRFYSEHHKEPILNIYQQFDGYIGGVGHQLASFLKTKTIINGIYEQAMEGGFANGMGCLAAQYVVEHKEKIGGFYIASSDVKEGYDYEVRYIDGAFNIVVGEFNGTPDELLVFDED